jgi:hypothetical protein
MRTGYREPERAPEASDLRHTTSGHSINTAVSSRNCIPYWNDRRGAALFPGGITARGDSVW